MPVEKIDSRVKTQWRGSMNCVMNLNPEDTSAVGAAGTIQQVHIRRIGPQQCCNIADCPWRPPCEPKVVLVRSLFQFEQIARSPRGFRWRSAKKSSRCLAKFLDIGSRDRDVQANARAL